MSYESTYEQIINMKKILEETAETLRRSRRDLNEVICDFQSNVKLGMKIDVSISKEDFERYMNIKGE